MSNHNRHNDNNSKPPVLACSLTLTRSTGQARTSCPAPPRQPARNTSKDFDFDPNDVCDPNNVHNDNNNNNNNNVHNDIFDVDT